MKENPDYGIRKIFTWPSPESSNICCWIRNPWFWKSGTHSKESWILLLVILKLSSTGTESGNPESTPQNPESKTKTTFHGFCHSRTSGKRPPKVRRLGGCLRVSNCTSLFREEVPRHLLLSKDCLHAVCICRKNLAVNFSFIQRSLKRLSAAEWNGKNSSFFQWINAKGSIFLVFVRV